MQGFINSIQNIYKWITPATWVIVLVALGVCGIAMITPSEKAHEFVKKHIGAIALGCILFLGAATIAKELVSKISY